MGLGTRACLALPQHPAELGGREREGRRGGGDRRRKGEGEKGRKGRRGQGRREKGGGEKGKRGKTKKQGKGESLIPNFIVTV